MKNYVGLSCCTFLQYALRKQINFLISMIHRTEKAHSSFIGKKFTVGKHHVVVEVEFIIVTVSVYYTVEQVFCS